ncbi:MAG: [Oscillospiraceae bacterium]|nr:[FeFe] hydrogenase, group A [Oscillospiraceae bacterium]
MVNLKINNLDLSVPEGTTILDAAQMLGISIPTLCYLKDINEIAACRVCLVEIKGIDKLITACNNVCAEGMEVFTNTARVRNARRINVDLILSQHRVNCPTCVRNYNCELQKVASAVYLDDELSLKREYPEDHWDNTFPIIRKESKCIRCYRCVSFCDKVQSLGIWDMIGTGAHTTVGVSGNRAIREADCAACGQCITHCPVNALQVRDDTKEIFGLRGAMANPDKIIVAQIAPAVRAAWGEDFGLSPEVATEKRMVTALKRLGFHYVFDTNFTADLTIMEEGTEFLERLKDPDHHKWPMFTSCCPGWVRFLKSQYPDMVPQLSTAKSPQQMFGAVTKSYFAKKLGVDPKDIVCVSIMPCSAKKAEADIPNINDAAPGCKDVDFSLTTREMCRMIRSDHQVDISQLPETEFDSPLGTGSGAAVIFGATGGVMEAALRTCYYVLNGKNPDPDAFKLVRGMDGWKEAEIEVGPGTKVKAAVVSGLGNTRNLIRAIRRGEVSYDFVEVMACPGGCAGGGGQPIHYNEEWAEVRAKALYDLDANNPMRFSHENPDVQTLYKEFLGSPCGEMSHHLLHTDHTGWQMPQAPRYDEDVIV